MKQAIRLRKHAVIDNYEFYRNNRPLKENKPDALLMSCTEFIPLLDFDVSALVGKRITQATLILQLIGEDYPVEVELTTVTHPWTEQADLKRWDGERRWKGEQVATDFIMEAGHSRIFRTTPVFDGATRLYRITVELDQIYDMVYGRSFGLGVTDRKSKLFDKEARLAAKRFNLDEQAGVTPTLEIEYDDTAVTVPGQPLFVGACENRYEESFESSSLAVRWENADTARGPKEYRYNRVYYSESGAVLPLSQMMEADIWRVPGWEACEQGGYTEISGLRPETVYTIAVTACSRSGESEPVRTTIRTARASVRPPLPDSEEEFVCPAGAIAANGIAVHVIDEFSKVNPITGDVYEAGPSGCGIGREGGKPLTGAGIRTESGVRLQGVPGETVAFQLVFEQEAAAEREWTLSITGSEAYKTTWNRIWYVPVTGDQGENWYPEAALPCDGTIRMPADNGRMTGQRFQAVLVEFALSPSVAPGRQSASIGIACGSAAQLSIPLELEVLDIATARSGFNFELLGYMPPPRYEKLHYGDEGFFETEEAYYRTADTHGMFVNTMPYIQDGRVFPGSAPEVEIFGGSARVTDWTVYDEHYSRYFDGSYFKDEAGNPRPVPVQFVPFFENWPMPVDDYYKIKASTASYYEMINEMKLKVTNTADDFDPAYREGIKQVFKDFIRHIDEMNWKSVKFLWYLNNKYIWKNMDFLPPPQADENKGGCCWWLLDEPLIRDDWEAIRYYGEILKEAQREMNSGYNIVYRVDISRYHNLYTTLDGVLGLSCISSVSFQEKGRLAKYRKDRYGEEFWVYGHLAPIDSPATNNVLNVLEVYASGGTGYLSWENFGKDEAYDKPVRTAGMYPGGRFGLREPAVSLRLKAARHALQLLDYLEAFKRMQGYNDLQIKAYIEQFVVLKGKSDTHFFDDAGGLSYGGGAQRQLSRLRSDLIRKLGTSQLKNGKE